MHALEMRILELFQKEPTVEFSTGEIVKRVFREEYDNIKQDLQSRFDSSKVVDAKRKKAKLHRKILYHLHKLVLDRVLKVSRIEERGEKCFMLNAGAGEVTVEKGKARVTIRKIKNISTPTDEYEKEGIVHTFKEGRFASRVNSMLLFGDKFSGINRLYSMIKGVFDFVNDVICVSHFEHVINMASLDELKEFIRNVDIDSKDYGKRIVFIIESVEPKQEEKYVFFLKYYSLLKPRNTEFIFSVREGIKDYKGIITKIVSSFKENGIRLNIHNRKLKRAPVMIGKAGVYSFEEEGYRQARASTKDLLGIICSECNLAIDIKNLFKENTNAKDLLEIYLKCAKTLLLKSSELRKNKASFLEIPFVNMWNFNSFIICSRNYLRLWNYESRLFDKDKKNLQFQDLFFELKDEIKKFCEQEETIYSSCGMPMRFKIALASCFNSFSEGLSKKFSRKTEVSGMNDLTSKDFIRTMNLREQIFSLFDQEDKMRIYRVGNFKGEEIFTELNYMLNSFNISIFSYDFTKPKKDISKLTDFL